MYVNKYEEIIIMFYHKIKIYIVQKKIVLYCNWIRIIFEKMFNRFAIESNGYWYKRIIFLKMNLQGFKE